MTHPGAPFAVGVTLEEIFARVSSSVATLWMHSIVVVLLQQTSDANWKPAIIKEAVQQIHKVLA